MTTTSKCIVACIDGSELSNAVIEQAIWLAQNSQFRLKFIHTIEHSHTSDQVHREGAMTPNMTEHLLDELSDQEHEQSKALIAQGKVILQAAMEKAQQAGLVDCVAKQRHGSLAETLQDLKDEYDLVVLGARGENHSDASQGLGSQLEQAIRVLSCPVFIVKDTFKQPSSILFAYNGSPTSKKALGVIKQAQFLTEQQTLHVVSVNKTQEQAQALVDEAISLLNGVAMPIESAALTGEASLALLAYQQQNNIDNIAMGAFSHGKLHGFFFGSFTTRMLLESNTNFLLIR